MKYFLNIFLTVGTLFSVCFAEDQTALPLVKVTIDKVVAAAESLRGESNRAERRIKLREIIDERFDFPEMAKRSLGANWLKLTPEQQTEFVNVFSQLLSKTYMNRVEEAKPGMISVNTEQLEFPRSIVKTKVSHEGQTFPIDYKLYSQNGAWKVYDVVIENIGLIANYRNEFSGTIRNDGFDALIIKLKDKL